MMSILLWLEVRPLLLCCLFDMIDLDCLSSWFGGGGVVLDYCPDCSEYVKIGSILYNGKKLLFGAPHRTVFCPVLSFLIYYSHQ